MRIGLMTSGGDCAGLNVVVQTVLRQAAHRDWEVVGIFNAANGLAEEEPDAVLLNTKTFPPLLEMVSGTFLGSAFKAKDEALQKRLERENPNSYIVSTKDNKIIMLEDILEKQIKKLKLDALVMTGGDDSLSRFYQLCAPIGLPLIGIPKTIDNDIKSIDRAIGFDTGVAEALHAMDNLRTTAYSHHRFMILEVMGNTAGHLAMHSGIAGGADVIIVPEFGYTREGVLKKIHSVMDKEKRNFGLVVVTELIKPQDAKYKTAAEEIKDWLVEDNISSRVTTLGHAQRGGSPVFSDRVLAYRMGAYAVKLLAEGKSNQMVICKDGQISSTDISTLEQGATRRLTKEDTIVQAALECGTYIGEIV